jgi:FG-GAP-like repeat
MSFRHLFSIIFIIYLCQCGSNSTTNAPAEPAPTQLGGEELAKIHCASCHQFTPPDLLPRGIWTRKVLPNMATRLGIPMGFPYQKLAPDDMQAVMAAHVIPDQPVLHPEDMQKIVAYYVANAPERLTPPERIPQPTQQMPLKVKKRTQKPISTQNTFLKALPEHRALLLSFEDKGTYWYDNVEMSYRAVAPTIVASDGKLMDSILYLLHIGHTEAYNLPRGRLWSIPRLGTGTPTVVLDSLIRPVSMDITDLNGDQKPDFVICEFGDYLGRLTLHLSQPNGGYQRQILRNYPGACKAIFRDMNNDNQTDIVVLMSQGREELFVYYNIGHTQFEDVSIEQFAPSYGSNGLIISDIDQDGLPDLITTNGDNADISSTLKPYHGVRVYRNEGNKRFALQWQYPMYGASGVAAADFDQDGHIDLAVIAHFPDFQSAQQEDLLYFRKTPDAWAFTPTRFAQALNGRLLTIDQADLDRDGRPELFIGNFLDQLTPVGARYADWKKNPVDWWMLSVR